MQEINERSERQADLYAYLMTREDRWTRMIDAVINVPGYPYGWTSSFHNSAGRRELTRDIEEINVDERYEKIIVSSTRGIKLANRKDFELFVASEYGEIFRKLRRVRAITAKGGLDMQQDLEGQIREAFMGGDQHTYEVEEEKDPSPVSAPVRDDKDVQEEAPEEKPKSNRERKQEIQARIIEARKNGFGSQTIANAAGGKVTDDTIRDIINAQRVDIRTYERIARGLDKLGA